MVPEGNSIAKAAPKTMGVNLKGFRQDIAFITLLFLSINKISIEKRIKKVWMELHGSKIRAWLFLNSFLPKRPFILLKGVFARITSSAIRELLVLLIIFINSLSFEDTLSFRLLGVPRWGGGI